MTMELKKFKKVLVANRGEIAIRVFRALNELGITTVGVFSKEDRYALFRSEADESYQLNPDKGPIDAYLDINTIIRIAKEKNVDAIHPGYGFLSENPDFVDACEKNGITFIGPSSSLMRKMGDKISSKQMAIEADVPIIPGVDHAVHGLEEVTKIANQVGYPVMLKASNGGGGRGMRIVHSAEEMPKEYVGLDEYIEKLKSGWTDIDIIITMPAIMGKIGALGRILGPRGLMPNPKSGTVTMEIGKAVKKVKQGKIDFKVDKFGIVHTSIGKVNFEAEKIMDNAREFMATIQKLKPSSAKGTYVKSVFLSSTMSPGIKLDLKSLLD